MQFFGLISALMILVAGVFFTPIVFEFVSTGLVPKFPTLIVCGFCVLAAILSFFTGLILSTIKHKERREFEFRLQQIDRWYKDLLKEMEEDILDETRAFKRKSLFTDHPFIFSSMVFRK